MVLFWCTTSAIDEASTVRDCGPCVSSLRKMRNTNRGACGCRCGLLDEQHPPVLDPDTDASHVARGEQDRSAEPRSVAGGGPSGCKPVRLPIYWYIWRSTAGIGAAMSSNEFPLCCAIAETSAKTSENTNGALETIARDAFLISVNRKYLHRSCHGNAARITALTCILLSLPV